MWCAAKRTLSPAACSAQSNIGFFVNHATNVRYADTIIYGQFPLYLAANRSRWSRGYKHAVFLTRHIYYRRVENKKRIQGFFTAWSFTAGLWLQKTEVPSV